MIHLGFIDPTDKVEFVRIYNAAQDVGGWKWTIMIDGKYWLNSPYTVKQILEAKHIKRLQIASEYYVVPCEDESGIEHCSQIFG